MLHKIYNDKIHIISCIIFFFIVMMSCNKDGHNEFLGPNPNKIISLQTIYAQDSLYCSFVDMIYYKEKYYVAFRVADNHVPTSEKDQNGFIKIMSSENAKKWHHELDIVDTEWDLRDPCFCVNQDSDELFLYCGLYSYIMGNPTIKNKRFTLSSNADGLYVSNTKLINVGQYSYYWLWKVIYHNNSFYSIGYFNDVYPILFSSQNGVDFKKVSEIAVEGNETALTFMDNKIIAFTRNLYNNRHARVEIASEPYDSWNIFELNEMLQSPEVCLYDSKIYVAGRSNYGVSVFIYDINEKTLNPFINLFAKGNFSDRGYPGMFCMDGFMYIAYYACNSYDAYPSIHLTTIKLN